MDANELMIGDWVQHQNHDVVGKVILINTQPDLMHYQNKSATIQAVYPTGNMLCHCKVSLLEPIPLTTEILEKNYGKETQVGISDKPCWGEMGAIWSTMLWKCENSFWLEVRTIAGGFVKKHILYVHELQHALRLAGIKKEIVL